MAILIKEIIKMGKKKDLEKKLIPMEIIMMGLFVMGIKMGGGLIHFQMVLIIKDILKILNIMDLMNLMILILEMLFIKLKI